MSEFHITDDIDIALMNGYIGEFPVIPKAFDDLMSELLTGKRLPSWINIYYGTPDERLKEVFGYE